MRLRSILNLIYHQAANYFVILLYIYSVLKEFSCIRNFREFNLLSTRALQQAVREETRVCERLNLLLDVLVAHRILCERHERGVSADHQRALSTMLSLKKRQMQGVIRGTDVSKSFEMDERQTMIYSLKKSIFIQ